MKTKIWMRSSALACMLGAWAAMSAFAGENVASAEDMTTVETVVEDWMEPIAGDALQDGTYEITVDSSSSMFSITDCALTVADGEMEAVMTMSGTGYLYVYMDEAEAAAQADEEDLIPFAEDAAGHHTFTVPVEALDSGLPCAAFSKKKEQWYARTLVFRSDSLPLEAWKELPVTTVADLGLEDGTYTIEATLQGGSGKATIESPALLTIEDGQALVTIVMSSKNYDYAIVDGERLEPVNTEGNSTFLVPVIGFDWNMPFTADTVAMSIPHEIDYTIYLDSDTILQENE